MAVHEGPGSITTLVNGIARGGTDGDDAPGLVRLQKELESLARARIRSVGHDAEIRTGDLVHEAYLKLFSRGDGTTWENRRHFFGAAARAMQQVVIDLVRKIEIRRAHAPRIDLPEAGADEGSHALPLPVMLELLDGLERADPVAAEVVRMRVFTDLSVEDTAQLLGLSLRTAQRKWTIARALARSWLSGRMEGR
jgi:RNA polymerase sigma factor (TIGR02999 family)